MRAKLTRYLGPVVLVVSVVLVVRSIDASDLRTAWRAALHDPGGLAAIVVLYLVAFVLRAVAWKALVPALSVPRALASLHVSLAANHVLPFRLGEAIRVTSAVKRWRVPTRTAVASTVALRSADIVALVALASIAGAGVMRDVIGAWTWVLAAAGAGWIVGIAWMRKLDEKRGGATVAPLVAGLAVVAWILESAVMYRAATWSGIDISFGEAIAVTAVTIGAQIVAVAPGGLGTYEAAGSAALMGIGAAPGPALAAALLAHAVKTVYSLVAGAAACFGPQPGEFGRLRARRGRSIQPLPAGPGPVVLFMPAHDEAATIGATIARVPRESFGRPVRTIVVDDGSTDTTATIARSAGAEVISLPENQGLGAAVRVGLDAAVSRGAAAVAFCDADGEYAPEELDRVVGPVLEGRADYVVGSRFAGEIGRMLPHRRLGNRLLTSVTAFLAREHITDGQSGYRAFSARAAQRAEVIHDYNYAQVITLDLLQKGYVYLEVPISYSFRAAGRSFVRLGTYLRRVIPAIRRELNEERSVLDDVILETSPGELPRGAVEAPIGT